MIILAAPQFKEGNGWYVAEDVSNGFFADYLHPDGKLYPSMNDSEGKLVGYFDTECEALKVAFNYYNDHLCSQKD